MAANETEGFKLISRFELFANDIWELTKGFPKADKYIIGDKMQRATLDLCEDLYLATYARELRGETLMHLRARVHLMGFLLRMSYNKKLLSPGHYNKLIKEQGEFSRMLSGWIKKQKFGNKNEAHRHV